MKGSEGMNDSLRKPLIIAALLLLAVVSCLYLADWASAPKTHAATAAELDDKVEDVMVLSAGATGAAVLVSMLPGDVATPVADKLADVSMYFVIVLCALYLEKYLASVLGLVAFRILIPAALVLFGVSLFREPRRLRALALKLAVVGLAVFLVIPASVAVSRLIDRSFESSFLQTVAAAEEFREEGEAEKENGILSGLAETVTGAVRKYTDKAVSLLNRFLQSLAVMIVTSCVIPLLVLLFFLWLLKQFTGLDAAGRVFRPHPRGPGGGKRQPEPPDGE